MFYHPFIQSFHECLLRFTSSVGVLFWLKHCLMNIYIYIISYHIMTYIRHLPPLCCILSPSYMESTTVIGLLALLDNKVLIQTGPLSNLWQPPVETLTCMHPYGCWRHFVYVELLFQGRILAVGCRSARKFAFNVSCCRPLRPYWSP